jgi:UV DNA damage repair endonuclease
MKIGFACKISEFNSKNEVVSVPDLNFKSTTVAWLNRQHKDAAEQKLWDLLKHNIEAAKKAVEYVGNLEEPLKMFRLGSDIMPVYTEPTWGQFWRDSSVRNYCARELGKVGDLARKTGVRLSMHPGQFCCLASDNPDIVERSIAEFEYHADVARWMGYGATFQDFKINVHISGKRGPEGFRETYKRLSPEARNTITIENEENTHGLAECLEVSDIVPIVLDIHHHYVREGEYINSQDDRIKQVIDSWRGVRPTMHYSQSREDYLDVALHTTKPDMALLLKQGYKKQKLRAHSDFMWNNDVNKWAHEFWPHFDIMVEAKGKNLASFALYEFWKSLEK